MQNITQNPEAIQKSNSNAKISNTTISMNAITGTDFEFLAKIDTS